MIDYRTIIAVQLLWLFGSVVWLIRRGDALPLVVSGFLFYVFGFRLWALIQGYANPIVLTPFGFKDLDFLSAISAFTMAVLGQSVLLAVYMLRQRASFVTVKIRLGNSQGAWLRSWMVLLAAFCIPLIFLCRLYISSQLSAGMSLGFQVSNYAFLFPFVLNSIAILAVSLWKSKQLPGAGWQIIAALLLGCVAWLSFGSSGRFLFLGWMLAAVFVVISGLSTFLRLLIATGGVAFVLAIFGAAGALRNENAVSEVGLEQGTWDRIFSAEDANMLDGFCLIRQVYPEMLPHTYGGEHLGILLRPIPRSWWPGKPVGSYMNELKLIDASDGFTLGISPSLFGDFYQEGSWIGIILGSALYGWGLAWLVKYSAGIQVFAGMSIRVILYAFMIPLLRGGDLPGIYAWFGMAFWPYLILFWLRRHDWMVRRHPAKPDRRSLPSAPALEVPGSAINTTAGLGIAARRRLG